MSNLSDLFVRFLTRAGLSSQDKADILGDLGVTGTNTGDEILDSITRTLAEGAPTGLINELTVTHTTSDPTSNPATFEVSWDGLVGGPVEVVSLSTNSQSQVLIQDLVDKLNAVSLITDTWTVTKGPIGDAIVFTSRSGIQTGFTFEKTAGPALWSVAAPVDVVSGVAIDHPGQWCRVETATAGIYDWWQAASLTAWEFRFTDGAVWSAANAATLATALQPRDLKPEGMLRMLSTKSSANITFTLRSSTGYMAVCWWDGSVTIAGAGAATTAQPLSKAIPASGDWSGSSPKEIYAWACDSAGAQSGDLTYLSCTSGGFTVLDVSGLTALTGLLCNNNNISILEVGELTALATLECSYNKITTLEVGNLTALTNLTCTTNKITALDISNLTALEIFDCSDNEIAALDFSSLQSLEVIGCGSNKVTSLDFSGLNNLVLLECFENSELITIDISGLSLYSMACYNCPNLVEVVAVGTVGARLGSHTSYNTSLLNCGMTTDAVWSMLNQMDYAYATPSFINLTGNPCDKNDGATTPEMLTDGATYTESDIATLLTTKEYSLVLSDGTLIP